MALCSTAGAQRNADAITARLESTIDDFNRNLLLIPNLFESKANRIYRLWKLADDLASYYPPNVACKKGCSYCCHIPVAMTVDEASAVGKRIGIEPQTNLNFVDNFDGRPFGVTRPCTFLKDNQCSIYEHRPLNCRIHYSVAPDTWGCEFGESGMERRDVPLLNNQGPFMMALLTIVQPKVRRCLADLVEFFPRSTIS